jgi:hypothetical protein
MQRKFNYVLVCGILVGTPGDMMIIARCARKLAYRGRNLVKCHTAINKYTQQIITSKRGSAKHCVKDDFEFLFWWLKRRCLIQGNALEKVFRTNIPHSIAEKRCTGRPILLWNPKNKFYQGCRMIYQLRLCHVIWKGVYQISTITWLFPGGFTRKRSTLRRQLLVTRRWSTHNTYRNQEWPLATAAGTCSRDFSRWIFSKTGDPLTNFAMDYL